MPIPELEPIIQQLESHLASSDFIGYDPFDALNSPLLRLLTGRSRLRGIAFVQLLKRCPINLRPFFRVRRSVNPKGWGLLTATYAQRYQQSDQQEDLDQARRFADWLIAHPAEGYDHACWGYNFDWPNRNAFFPAGTPTGVNTYYIASALLDLHAVSPDARLLDTAVSATRFVQTTLLRCAERNGEWCYSYTPRGETLVHNASLLCAALLARAYALTGDSALADDARGAVSYSLNRQRADGSWWYGEESRNRWIDSYHTGYNLLALADIQRAIPDPQTQKALEMGFRFYLDHFFSPHGDVTYYHDRPYPLDAHAAAHALLTLCTLDKLDPERSRPLLQKVLTRTIENFWNPRRGCFYYLRTRRYTNRIDYTRWVQCWMFRALVHAQAHLKAFNLELS